MTTVKPCQNCGHVPYPPTDNDLCDVCRTASPRELQRRAVGAEARKAEHARELALMDERHQRAEQLRRSAFDDARGPRPCARCSHPRLIRYKVDEHRDTTFRGPMCVSSMVHQGREIPLGPFIAYICEACGFVDWYVAQPSKIPIDGERTTLVDCDGAPYR